MVKKQLPVALGTNSCITPTYQENTKVSLIQENATMEERIHNSLIQENKKKWIVIQQNSQSDKSLALMELPTTIQEDKT